VEVEVEVSTEVEVQVSKEGEEAAIINITSKLEEEGKIMQEDRMEGTTIITNHIRMEYMSISINLASKVVASKFQDQKRTLKTSTPLTRLPQ